MKTNYNISSSLESTVALPQTDIIDGEAYAYITLFCKFGLFPVLGVVALFSNVINVVVFYKMGLSDGVTQNYFILSMSDGLFALVNVANVIGYVFVTITRTFERFSYLIVEAQTFYWLTYFSFLFPQFASLATTVVIAVVRSCCVAMPFQVRFLFTGKRQLAAILALTGIGLISLSYSIVPLHLVHVYNSQTNRSIVYFDGLRWNVLTPFMTLAFGGGFIVVTISVMVLSRSLRQASKFRDASATRTFASGHNKEDFKQMNSIADRKTIERQQRDTRVIKTVVLVSVVFIVTNIPVIAFHSLRLLLPGFNPGGRYKNANQLNLMLTDLSTMFSAAVNIFIYVFNNTRYRSTFMSLFGIGSSCNNGPA